MLVASLAGKRPFCPRAMLLNMLSSLLIHVHHSAEHAVQQLGAETPTGLSACISPPLLQCSPARSPSPPCTPVTTASAPTQSQCQCQATAAVGFWDGEACDQCLGGYWGLNCLDDCPGGGATPCTGHGTCRDGRLGSGECVCGAGYVGAACSILCPLSTSGAICSGNGGCNSMPFAHVHPEGPSSRASALEPPPSPASPPSSRPLAPSPPPPPTARTQPSDAARDALAVEGAGGEASRAVAKAVTGGWKSGLKKFLAGANRLEDRWRWAEAVPLKGVPLSKRKPARAPLPPRRATSVRQGRHNQTELDQTEPCIERSRFLMRPGHKWGEDY